MDDRSAVIGANSIRAIHVINSLGVGGAERQLSMLVGQQFGAVSHIVRPLKPSDREVEIDRTFVRGGRGPVLWSVMQALAGSIVDSCKSEHAVLIGWMYHSWLIVLIAHLVSFRRVPVALYCRHGSLSGLRRLTRRIAIFSLYIAAMLRVPVVFNSESASVAHQQVVRGLDTRVIPNGVDLPRGKRRRRECAYAGIVGFLGRNHPDKGADRLIELIPELLAENPGWAAKICGPGVSDLAPKLSDALARLGIESERVSVADVVSDIDSFFGDIDLLLVPSRTESFPNVVIEAAVRGVVPVCIGVGDIPSILEGLVPVSSDVPSLKELLSKMCRMPREEFSRIGDILARRVSEKFAIQGVAEAHLALWKELCRG